LCCAPWLQVEVRPELWGRYAAVLNSLQGVLTALVAAQPPAAATSGSRRRAAAGHAGSSSHTHAEPFGLESLSDKEQLLSLLAGLLQQLEGVVTSRKPPSSGGASVESAYAKAKQILLSVVKRYKRRLPGSTQPGSSSGGQGRRSPRQQHQHQQHSPYGRGGASGQRRMLLGGMMLACGTACVLALAAAGGQAPSGWGCEVLQRPGCGAIALLHTAR
jgi:hypothetical protein